MNERCDDRFQGDFGHAIARRARDPTKTEPASTDRSGGRPADVEDVAGEDDDGDDDDAGERLELSRFIDHAHMGGGDAPAVGSPDPRLHLPTDLAGHAVAPEQG